MVYYKKTGFPGIKDIVLCKVKKILPHSVFVELIEYDNKEGMIHISELSSRWTRNISEIVTLNSIIVCRVEKIDESKGYIDLSKKRVTSGEEKAKKDEMQNEIHIEKIIEHSLKKNNITLKDFYEKQGYKLIEEYGSLYLYYQNYLENPKILNDLVLGKKVIEHMKESFESLIQKNRVTKKNIIKFYANGEKGLKNLKEFIEELTKIPDEDSKVTIKYMNSPEYLVSINSSSYKKADIFFEKITSLMKTLSKKFNISVLP
ncbi:MAG: S1 RNA-binding domain-containing protein [Candidatus Nanoarchaeia archaeon]|nr:S1 RNA-binding domain-containing protein [Candidatus Nanoarchaeia archaeon]